MESFSVWLLLGGYNLLYNDKTTRKTGRAPKKRIRRKRMTYKEILAAAMRQSAIDCSCGEEDFRRDAHVFVENKASEQVSKFLKSPNTCRIVSYGSNIVASCRRDLIPEVEAFVNGQEKFHRCFEPLAIYELNQILQKADARVTWMHTFYLPDPDAVFSAELTCPYEMREMYPEDFTDLYVPEWSNALSSPAKKIRRISRICMCRNGVTR